MTKKTFRLVTLGCRTNQYETQAYRDQLTAMGYQEADREEGADLCIVNTCTVTESADQNSRYQIRKLMRENPKGKIIATGCLAEKQGSTIERMGVRVVSNRLKENLLKEIFPEEEIPEFSIKRFEAHTRAFVKVQDGCNSFCTYCVIPYVRGRSRSRKIADVVREVIQLVESGYQEVVITGINVGDFEDEGQKLADLVRAIDAIEGIKRIRISSIDPDEVGQDLLDAIIEGKHTCHSLHLVLQSGSNVTLKRMGRKYTRQIFLETVEKLRKSSLDFTFTTDVIVGFPGETDGDFAETLEVMQHVQFAKVHMFPYSRREKTRAALYPNQIPADKIEERKNVVLRLSEKIAFELREQYVGKTLAVLTEGKEGDYFVGHTENFLTVKLPAIGLKSNQLIEAMLWQNSPEGLLARISHKFSEKVDPVSTKGRVSREFVRNAG